MNTSASGVRSALKGVIGLSMVLVVLGTLVCWLVPLEVLQSWQLKAQPATDDFDKMERLRETEALWTLTVWGGPVVAVALTFLWSQSDRLADHLTAAFREFLSLTDSRRITLTWLIRSLLCAALGLGLVHQGGGWLQRLRDWPYYRFRSGEEVLPNISSSNRDVIRSIKIAAPENSRIFVLSDQSPYFLAYYLWPRVVLHRVHPEAEHLIPQPGQIRQFTAYTREDLPEGILESQRPDFIVEYFAGVRYFDPTRSRENANWLKFIRYDHGDPGFVPDYTFVMGPYEEDGSQ